MMDKMITTQKKANNKEFALVYSEFELIRDVIEKARVSQIG